MKKIGSILMLLALCLISCNNTDDLQDDVDALKIRVTALESQIRDINKNIESVSELVQNGIFITRIEEQADAYALTLNNGQTLSLYMKNDKNLLCPLIGIDKDGYWTVCYDTEAGFKQLLVDGEPVKAKGEDGKTPEFTVDADGFWKIRYGKEEEFRFVYKEGTTEKVSATGGGSAATDSFFEKVEVADNELVLTLKGNESNTVIRIPIVSEFELSFAGEVGNTVQEFAAGETRMFEMTLRGVESTMISAPEGWTAVLNDAKLTVTAPATSKAVTRATADNSNEIAILATHGKYAMIAKMQVKVNAESEDYKSMFESGKLKIGEETINPEDYTAQILDGQSGTDLSALLGASEATIVFLTGSTEFTIKSTTAVTKPIIIIGQDPKQKQNIAFDEAAFLTLKSGKLMFKNVNIKARAANYLFNSPATGDALFTDLTIEDCKMTNLTKAMYYVGKTTVGIEKITLKNSLFEFVNTGNIPFFNISGTLTPSLFKKLDMENNIVYHKTGVASIQLFNWNTKTTTDDTGNMTVHIKNNSFINVKGSNVFVKTNKAAVNYEKNIFCIATESTLTSYLYELKDNASTATATDNIVYDTKTNWNYANTDVAKPENNIMDKVENIPFTEINTADGIFTKDPMYADKGSNLNK